ncbi:MAG: cytidine deaminase [Bacillales bacterium]|nr:cytidine deaminase [Bacillales bacterium]
MNQEELINHAKNAMKLSYSPYSNYPVGAAILTKDGNIFYGANIENCAYPSGICAERCAIFHTYMHGYRKEDIVSLTLVADSNDLPYPCGACRQVLSELFPLEGEIIIANLKGKVLKTNIKELLPYTFEPANLEK